MAVEGRTHRPVIDYARCDTCSVCIQACPAEIVPEMRGEEASLRGKIYSDVGDEIRIYDEKAFGLPPCQLNCPLHQDVRGYMRLIAERRYREALKLIRETNPLPSVCGYICHHPCEEACRRGPFDAALSIKSLKRFVADYDDGKLGPAKIEKAKGKKVAIVGAGPAGLTAAHELSKNGYEVEIVESYYEEGGMLAWAIPSFRLPREVLRRDIEYIKKMGVTTRTGIYFGPDVTISDLQRGGAEAIIIATGTHLGLRMNIEHEDDFEGYFDCLTFLKRYANHEETSLGEEVLVVGGGNAAIDTARSAVRIGAGEVTILYRRGPEEMPADNDEVEEALIEGVNIECLTAPVRMIALEGRVNGLECVRTELHQVPDSERPRPVPIAGSEFVAHADTIISAVGQEPDHSWMVNGLSLDITPKKTLTVNSETMLTSMDRVFAAGDAVNGPTTVVEAMASGKRVARAVDDYLSVTV